MFYEEFVQGEWRRLELDGERLVGRPHHVIYFGSVRDWNKMPEWAHGRRREIISRVKSVFPLSDYSYSGEECIDSADLEVLVREAGGLSDELCAWADCDEPSLASKAICVTHACPEGSLVLEQAFNTCRPPRRGLSIARRS